MVTKVNICDSLSDGAQTTSSTSSGYASHPSSNNNTEPAKLDVERRSDGNLELGGGSTVSTLVLSGPTRRTPARCGQTRARTRRPG